jgi:hypothetical protein
MSGEGNNYQRPSQPLTIQAMAAPVSPLERSRMVTWPSRTYGLCGSHFSGLHVTMLGVAFSAILGCFALTREVIQGIVSGFIFPFRVRALPTSDPPLQLTRVIVHTLSPQWSRKKRAFSTGVVLAGSSGTFQSLAYGNPALIRAQVLLFCCCRESLSCSGLRIDKNWGGHDRPRSHLPSDQRTTKTPDDSRLSGAIKSS